MEISLEKEKQLCEMFDSFCKTVIRNCIPSTPDLYTQLLQKISEIQEVRTVRIVFQLMIFKENGFAGTLAEWLESLKGADGLPGKDGKDGETPDMSEYPPTSVVTEIP